MRKKILFGMSVLAAGLLLAACGAAGDGGQSASLAGTAWQLASYEGTSVLPGTNPTLIFEDGGVASGNASCNSFSGRYGAAGQEIFFEEVMYTAMACMNPAGIMEQEDIYMKTLLEVNGYRIEEDRLVLLIDEQPVLTFAPAE